MRSSLSRAVARSNVISCVPREQRGCDGELVKVAEGTDVSGLYQQLFVGSPLRELRVMFAVNQGYVASGHGLRDGDEVAFIPPLGGG